MPVWLLLPVLAVCLLLIWLLKVPGLVLSLVILGLFANAYSRRAGAGELSATLAAIELSARDISDVLDEFDEFCTGADAEQLADRTLLRPALADKDCTVPAIASFHEDYANAQRYLHRLPARLAAPMSQHQAAHLLEITDERAAVLRQSWVAARRAARELGTN
ncbi:hypothetical protein WG915_00450 [Corynebacterium sp. H128]|uniref:hypothetical protein n=1 Tax=unclassified Corynebacterium TaxID=2624378 RepID=UPI0030B079A3